MIRSAGRYFSTENEILNILKIRDQWKLNFNFLGENYSNFSGPVQGENKVIFRVD